MLDHSLGWIDCRIVNVFPGGDHSIIVGHVEALGGGEGRPLLYHRGKYPKIKTSRTAELLGMTAYGRLPDE